jgi:predicted  nucleic acid-binding Zn-ribbon protein
MTEQEIEDLRADAAYWKRRASDDREAYTQMAWALSKARKRVDELETAQNDLQGKFDALHEEHIALMQAEPND